MRIERFKCAWWFIFGKYALRIGKPWCGYRYAWHPFFSFFRLYR